MDELTRLFGARICAGLLLITVVTLVILAYQEFSTELAREAEFYIASSLNQFDSSLAVK